MINKNNYKKFFFNKKVLITGHTGFKGSWLALWMHSLGANVLGISNEFPSKPSHSELIGLNNLIKSKKIDIQNHSHLKKIIKSFEPDFIFHLAAQSIVKKSYSDSLNTWKTNLIGTVNILEILKDLSSKKKKETIVILITSDKVYKNIETSRGYKERDILGGIDPYGASKSAAEIAIKSYIKSFFNNKNNKFFIATARAGNVIGGGDWSDNRLLPDCIRSWSKNKIVNIRSPNSTRPWQNVLDVINGYITLSIKLKKNKKLHGEEFNFGPSDKNYRVIEILKKIKKRWPSIDWKINKKKFFFENSLLNLNSKKAKQKLKWKTKLNIYKNLDFTIDWYKYYLTNKKNKKKILFKSLQQLTSYQQIK